MDTSDVQMVILAGGRGTRLGSLTENTPKSMVRIHGKPFLEYQFELLHRHSVTDVVLCVGCLTEQIEAFFGDGHNWDMSIKYSYEREQLLGTAGALRNAMPLLRDRFLVMYGDSYLLLDYPAIMRRFCETECPAMMVVYRNEDRFDRSNVVVRDGLVVRYDKKGRTEDMVYIDEGLTALRREVLNLVSPGQKCDLSVLFRQLIASGQMLAYETRQRFYEIGSPKGLEEFARFVGGDIPC